MFLTCKKNYRKDLKLTENSKHTHPIVSAYMNLGKQKEIMAAQQSYFSHIFYLSK